ncbi:unnamed protein product [marine sediment metagenome]|uniref:Methyltransferase domain-containing protein n=1 Tax=marine sediment metagenome TaxID=412755 RepID=X1C9G8_9ZZZZ
MKKYRKYSSVFCETGSGNGEGIQAALDAGFEKVYSMDAYAHKFKGVKERFKNKLCVELFLGDSADVLKSLLSFVLNKRCVLWLDAHWSGAHGEASFDACPILRELSVIKESVVKNHIILIDDIFSTLL